MAENEHEETSETVMYEYHNVRSTMLRMIAYFNEGAGESMKAAWAEP